VALVTFKGDGFEIEHRWKEEVIYWESEQGFLFDAGWGVNPPVLYIPSVAIWREVMPDWCRERRDEVVARLREHSQHALQEDVHGYYRNSPGARLMRR
jgi:hypothetical protein